MMQGSSRIHKHFFQHCTGDLWVIDKCKMAAGSSIRVPGYVLARVAPGLPKREHRACDCDEALLQWGRDQLTAEIFRCGNYGVWDQLLQWGRDHLIAEIAPAGTRGYHMIKLQWGRDHLIAEMSQIAPFFNTDYKLQWDRDQFIAEISDGAIMGSGTNCFNGATIS